MRLTTLAVITIVFLAAGCSAVTREGAPEEYLDRATGVTVTHLDAPVVFSHAAPRLAVHARDYVYMGPLEINRTGKREYYLWVAE